MICNRCGIRFAPFPEGDFVLEAGSFIPITEFAEANRTIEYEKDDKETCMTCEIIEGSI